MVGLGLYDEKDISVKGYNILRKVDKVFAEFYTSKLFGTNIEKLENFFGRKIEVLERKEVEEEMIPVKEAKSKNVAFLVPGDPLIATTHQSLIIEAKKLGIDVEIIHSSSILSAAPGITGLQAYRFGKTTTIPFPEDGYFPHSPYLTIKKNLENEAHTLVLLDIKSDENKYMTANEGLEYLLKVEKERKEGIINNDRVVIVLARIGSHNPVIKVGRVSEMINENFGKPLHCLVIPASLHFMEYEYLTTVLGAKKEILEDIV